MSDTSPFVSAVVGHLDERIALTKRPDLDLFASLMLAMDVDDDVRDGIARNVDVHPALVTTRTEIPPYPQVPIECLFDAMDDSLIDFLISQERPELDLCVATRRTLSEAQLEELITRGTIPVLQQIIREHSWSLSTASAAAIKKARFRTAKDTLLILWGDTNLPQTYREAIDGALPTSKLSKLIGEHWHVAAGVARNREDLPPSIEKKLAKHPVEAVRCALALNTQLSAEAAGILAGDDSPAVVATLARSRSVDVLRTVAAVWATEDGAKYSDSTKFTLDPRPLWAWALPSTPPGSRPNAELVQAVRRAASARRAASPSKEWVAVGRLLEPVVEWSRHGGSGRYLPAWVMAVRSDLTLAEKLELAETLGSPFRRCWAATATSDDEIAHLEQSDDSWILTTLALRPDVDNKTQAKIAGRHIEVRGALALWTPETTSKVPNLLGDEQALIAAMAVLSTANGAGQRGVSAAAETWITEEDEWSSVSEQSRMLLTRAASCNEENLKSPWLRRWATPGTPVSAWEGLALAHDMLVRRALATSLKVSPEAFAALLNDADTEVRELADERDTELPDDIDFTDRDDDPVRQRFVKQQQARLRSLLTPSLWLSSSEELGTPEGFSDVTARLTDSEITGAIEQTLSFTASTIPVPKDFDDQRQLAAAVKSWNRAIRNVMIAPALVSKLSDRMSAQILRWCTGRQFTYYEPWGEYFTAGFDKVESEPQGGDRVAIERAIMANGSTLGIATLVELQKSNDSEIRERAQRAISELGEADVVAALLLIGTPDALASITESDALLRECDTSQRQTLVGASVKSDIALARNAELLNDQTIALLAASPSYVARRILAGSAKSEWPAEVIDALRADSDDQVRTGVARALSKAPRRKPEKPNDHDLAGNSKSELIDLIVDDAKLQALTPAQQVALATHNSVDVPRALAKKSPLLHPETHAALAHSKIFTARRELVRTAGTIIDPGLLEQLANDDDEVVQRIARSIRDKP